AATGKLSGISAPDGGSLAYTYDGPLPLSSTWAGAVPGSVVNTFNNDFRLASRSVNGGSTVNFGYDNDGLLTQAGSLALSYDANNGLPVGTTLGSLTTTLGFNTFAELESYAASYGAVSVFASQYMRDKLGRITRKVETVSGSPQTTEYAYDIAGRLTQVTVDSVVIATYAYDPNGNRIEGTYDDQDRMLAYGGFTYTYTANGELLTKAETATAQTTTYDYDVLGNLMHVTRPDGTNIDYTIDGQNRRIGKRVGGSLVQGFLYADQLNPIAELDGAGNVVSRFVYGSKTNVPDYLIKGGATYRIISDHLGSPRLIIDTSTGDIVQQIEYDEFGNITSDTNPGFQPFGFAGGLYDQDTKLTRFGLRDYDAHAGRWTSKDSILFDGGDTNLFGYVTNDPVNFVDPDGRALNYIIVIILIRIGGYQLYVAVNPDTRGPKLQECLETGNCSDFYEGEGGLLCTVFGMF
ncbi:MAG: RHS repeat-associated core domain-containing protein, partial [Candidatus Omnitrophica bacterium]|nr:RHS repeat-associated core domain-containing protein [Candidatus Omnitrophota bacterium]